MRSESEDVIYHMKCNTGIRRERALAARETEVKMKMTYFLNFDSLIPP